MTVIYSGHGQGLLDGSLGQLNRQDTTGKGTLGGNVEAYANVSNGNLLLQERDGFLPSNGLDFGLVRTYNSRGLQQGSPDGWYWSTTIVLTSHQDKSPDGKTTVTNHEVTYGDGTVVHFTYDPVSKTWLSTDGVGAYEKLEAITGNPALKFKLTRADGSQYFFDKDCRVNRIVDTNNVSFDIVYNTAGRITTVRDDTGHTIAYKYDPSNRLISISDQHAGKPDVVLASYAYTGGRLSQVTDRFGHKTTYTYNAKGLLTKVTLPFQQVVGGATQTYDKREISFNYKQVTWGDNPHRVTPFDSGPEWVVESIIDPMGAVTRFDYTFRFDTKLAAGDRDLFFKTGGTRFYTGGTTRVLSPNGAVNTYTFDADGYITQVIDALGSITNYTWGGRSAAEAQTAFSQDNLLSVTDRNGHNAITSDSSYWREQRRDLGFVDTLGNGKLVSQLSATDKQQLAERFTTRYTYDERGNRLTETDGLGNRTVYTYTPFNKVASMTSPMGHALATSDAPDVQAKRVELGYPALVASLLPGQADALRALYTTTYAYDARQNLVVRTDPGGDQTLYEYDAYGNVTRKTEVFTAPAGAIVAADVPYPALNRVTTYAYDALGNLTSIVDPEGKVQTRTYDDFGNLLTSTDGKGGVTRYAYDADNRMLSMTDPEGHTTVYRYDAIGNRIAIVDANGKTVTQVFDKNNLLISTVDPGALAANNRTTTFKYDVVGNRTEVTDAEGRRTTYTYDAIRQLVRVTQPQVKRANDTLVAYVTTYAYDGEGKVITTTDGNGAVTLNAYTANGLLKRTTDATGNVTESLYDANNNRLQVTVGAQLAVGLRRVLRFGYDEENQLVTSTDALGGATVRVLDAVGNVVAVTDANGNRTDYVYDRNNRLLKEIRPLLAGQTQAQRYTVLHQYDANGNEVATTDENGNTTRYTFDKDDNLVMVSDANGVETVYAYDSRHNVTTIAIGVQATLDGSGKPVISDRTGAQVTTFVYDEFNQVVSSTDGVGNALVTLDAAPYQAMRQELGYAALAANLSTADRTALLNRYTERYGYDKVGNLVRSTDHLGNVTASTYDALNRLESRIEAQGNALARTTTLRYDANGNVVRSVDGRGNATVSAYDAMNRLVEVTDALGVKTRIEYDHVGNIVADTANFGAANARRTQYVYDLNDRVTREIDPLGQAIAYEYDAVGNRLKTTDAKGNVTREFFDAMNRKLRILDAKGFETRLEYDGVGNQITLVDGRGGVARFTYDPVNRLISSTDAEGRVTTLAYDVLGNVVTRTTAAGTGVAEVTRYVYDAEGNLRSTTDALGNVETRRYDDGYALTAVRDGKGNTTTYGWDALRRQVRITNPAGGITTYAYDAADNVLTETDPAGRVRRFAYDADDRVTTETDALGVETRYTYSAFDEQLTVVRAANRPQAATTTYTYDADGRLLREVDARGGVRTYAYDDNDNVVAVTDENGHVTRYEYDALDQVVKITDPLGGETLYSYDGNGNRVQVQNARGFKTTTYYNGNDEVVMVVDARGFATTRAYDANGNLVSERLYMTPVALPVSLTTPPTPTAGANDRVVSYQYDLLNRVIAQVDPLGGSVRYTYDAVGNVVTQTDERNNATQYAYDANDRLVRRTDALGNVTTYAYDAVGNLVAETDALGRTTTNEYDAENRIVRSTNAKGAVTTFTYDAVGNATGSTDARGKVVARTYDLLDRLIELVDENGVRTTYEYDAVGNLVKETRAAGTAAQAVITYTYDDNDRIATRTDELGNVITYGHDANGNRTSVTEPGGATTSTVYDERDDAKSSTDGQGKTVSTVLDGEGNAVSETDANNRTTVEYFDRNGRLILTVDPAGYAEGYRYDAAGNLVENTRYATRLTLPVNPAVLPSPSASAGDKVRTYTYDALNRLLTIVDGEGYRTTFTYDAVGNQIQVVQQVDTGNPTQDDVRRQYFDELGRLVATLTSEGHLSTVEYDATGNVVKRTDHDDVYTPPANGQPPTPNPGDTGHVATAEYDNKGRLIKETDPNGVVTEHTYDERGNETKTVIAGGTQDERRTDTTYDKKNRVVDATDAMGIVTHYVYDANDNVIERYEAWGRPEQRKTSYVYNNLNQLVEMTDALGTRSTYTYDAFGNKISQTLAVGKPEQRTETFQYDGNNRLIRQTNGEGESIAFGYDGAGNQTSITIAPGTAAQRIRSFEYDGDHRLVAEVDGNGVRTEYAYDGAGNRTDVWQAVNRAGQTRHSQYAYDQDGRLVAVTDPEGGVTEFEYDALGNQTRIVTPGGHVTVNTYDKAGRLVTSIAGQDAGAQGIKTVNTYDAHGNLVRVEQSFADGSDLRVTTYAYDDLGRQTLVTDGEGFSTRFTYDAFGNQVKLETGLYLPAVGSPGYDAAKAARAQTVALDFTYDKLDRLLTTTSGVGSVVASTYDAFGNRLTQTTRQGANAQVRTVEFTYDKANRVVARDTPAGGRDELTYDEAGNQLTLRVLQSGSGAGARWSLTSYTFDGNGKVVNETGPLGVITRHVYDAVGNEVETIQGFGTGVARSFKTEFDLNNRVVAEIDPTGARTDFVLDADGNRIRETDALGRVTHLYFDALGRHAGTVDAEGYYTAFTRDAAGNITETRMYANRVTVPGNDLTPPNVAANAARRTTTYTFDRAGNLVTQVGTAGDVTRYAYSSTRKLIQVTTEGTSDSAEVGRTWLKGARVQTFEYDVADRMVRFVDANGVIEEYSYDSANNRVGEKITNPTALVSGAADPVRFTRFDYDEDNRLVRQAFDPSGLNLETELDYDFAGNVVRRRDANNHETSVTYDLANRQTKVVNPLLDEVNYTYDQVDNITSVTDARGNRTDLFYDAMGRVVEERAPQVTVYNFATNSTQLVRPTKTTQYDEAGNIVRLVDANGNRTTRWYDDNDNMIAELNGENALRTYVYNAYDELVSVTQYMNRLGDAAHDGASAPTPPSGEARTVTSVYDAGGRIVQVVYPQIKVTSVSTLNGGTPTVTTTDVVPVEDKRYDRFGNLVESTDRNGARTVSYYDVKGRVVATVDPAGYLTELFYDSQNNVVRQVRHDVPLASGGVSNVEPDVRPSPAAAPDQVIDWTYDAANRVLSELSGEVETVNGPLRVRTDYTYDKNGNQTSRTIAANTTSDITDYSWYDAMNRRIATVDGARALVRYEYDENGNLTKLRRSFNTVGIGVNLANVSYAALVGGVANDATNDQERQFSYDAVNRQTLQVDVMQAGSADDVAVKTEYDAAGNVTRRTDALNFQTRSRYNEVNLLVQTVTPDNNSSYFEYDTGGLRTRTYTGDLGSVLAVEATDVSASVGDDLEIAYNVSQDGLTSYVVFDTVSRSSPDGYVRSSGTYGSGAVVAEISLTGFGAGSTIYYRVITRDAAGSIAWTEERRLVVPVRTSSLQTTLLASDSAKVSVAFNGPITSATLLVTPSAGGTTTSTAMSLVSGRYEADASVGGGDIQDFDYQIRYVASGVTYTTDKIPFEAGGTHQQIVGTGAVTWPVPAAAGGDTTLPDGQVVIVDGVRVSNAGRDAQNGLRFDPALSANGTHPYSVFYGDVVPGTHSMAVEFKTVQQVTVVSTTDILDGSNNKVGETKTLRWVNDSQVTDVLVNLGASEAARVNAGGVLIASKPAGTGDSFGPGAVMAASGTQRTATLALGTGSHDVKVYFIDQATGREVIVEWRRITVPAAAGVPADFTITDNSAPFDYAGQTVNSNGEVVGPPFDQTHVASQGTTVLTVSGQSVVVTASERGGVITRTGGAGIGTLAVDPGFYTGPLDIDSVSVPVPSTTTNGSTGGSRKSDGSATGGYLVEIEYNALGAKIGSNEDTGLWRRYGVDAMGNAVVTSMFGTQAAESANLTPIRTYAAYDARGLQVTVQQAIAAVDTNGDGTNDQTAGAVVRNSYDYAGRLVQRSGSGATSVTYAYDAVGNLVAETNALNQTVRHAYDARGQMVRRTDALGHITQKVYNAAGRMTQELDGTNRATNYTYDTYGRIATIADALGNTATYTYDQLDRIVALRDAAGRTTRYVYDKRGDRVWTTDANGHWFGARYDAMRRVTGTFSFQGSSPADLNTANAAVQGSGAAAPFLVSETSTYDVFGNKTRETNANGNSRTSTYGAFGRLSQLTDEEGRTTAFSYDRFGRSIREQGSNGKDIARTYDDANRLLTIDDNGTSVDTTYTYDLLGNRAHEVVRAPDFGGTVGTARNITYRYDATSRISSWADSVTGTSMGWEYDAAGNVSRVTGSDGTDHRYGYDNADRLLTIRQGTSTVIATYTYDAVGRRATYNDGSSSVAYTYDVLDRVTRAGRGDGTYATWTYDSVGNVLVYAEFKADNTRIFNRDTTYTANNRTLIVNTEDKRDADSAKHSSVKTTNTLDKAGRVLTEVSEDLINSTTTTYTHAYTASGRETSVSASGGSTGSSTSTYDVNDKLIRLDLGQNDSQQSPEYKRFIHSNDGQVLRRFHDDGVDGNTNTTTQYLYALGHIIGETGNNTANATVTLLDTGPYTVVDQIGEDFPTGSVTDYQVNSGDTLRSIAGSVYGNPSLWYLIADANGLSGDDDLKAGTQLKIPNRVELGRYTHETHVVYDESEIVGSRLPNLKAPPPSDSDKCAAIGAIIGVIALAIVGVILTIVTVGAAAPAVAAAVGAAAGATAGIVAGVLVGAAIGAVIAFGVSALSQVVLVAGGLQKEIDWTQVLADTAVGFLSGGVAGLGELISAGIIVGRVAKIASVVASGVLEATGETIRQVIVNPDHRPDNPLTIVLAGVGGSFGAVASIATRAAKLQSTAKVALAFERSGVLDESLTVANKFRGTIRKLQDGTKIVRIVTEDGSIVYKQVSRVSSQAAKAGKPVSKVLDVITTKPNLKGASDTVKLIAKQTRVKVPTNTINAVLADVKAVQKLTFAQRATSVLTDAFGARVGNALVKAGSAIGKLASKVGSLAVKAAKAVGNVAGGIGTVIAGAGKTVAGALKTVLSPVGTAIARVATLAVKGLGKLGGLLAKPFKAAAQGVLRTALGANAAGKIRAVRWLATAAVTPFAVGVMVAKGVGKFGKAAGQAVVKLGRKIGVGFEKFGGLVGKVANGLSKKASSAVRALADTKFGRGLATVGSFFRDLGRGIGRTARDTVLGLLDPLSLPQTIVGAALGGLRVAFRTEGNEGTERATYFRTENGLRGPTVPAYGTQGPAGGIGKAAKGVFSGELPFRPKFQAPSWENNAAQTTTSVYSGFTADRGLDLQSFNALNLLRLGRIGAMDPATRADFAAAVYGNVSLPADEVPVDYLDPGVPIPTPVLDGEG